MRRFKHKLGKTVSVNAINKNINTNVNFVSNYKELPFNEISEIVNAGDIFTEEREASDKYRLLGTIRLIASNPLLDISGDDSLSILDGDLFRRNSFDNSIDLTFEESYNTYLKEVDGWYSYSNISNTSINNCNKVDFSPKRSAFEVVTSADTNWYFCVTYPYAIDSGHTFVNGGLLIVDTGTAIIGSIEKQLLITPVKHNLVAGDKVRLSAFNIVGSFVGDYTVIRVGNDAGDLKDYTFVIDLIPSITVGTGSNIRMKKLYNGEESNYYFRKFSAITEVNDYEIYNLAYSINIYGDKVSQITFNGGQGNSNDLQLNNLKDNLGRPISELYFTAIKGKRYGDRNFSSIKSGLYIPFIGGVVNYTDIPDIRRIHNVTSHDVDSHTPLESNIEHTDTEFYGDIVEYNRLNLKEIVLSEVNYRFNTEDRDDTDSPNIGGYEMGRRPEGYMYKPHHKINIREFSSYIEEGDSSTYNIPDYATPSGDGKYIWRDLLPLGFNDGGYESALDYPFLNGAHYIHSNIMLNVRRQDPFNEYGLYYSKFPRDPFGDKVNIDNFERKGGDYVC